MQVSMRVNGDEVTREIEGRLLLVHFLRDHLGLTGTHWGCDTSNCGACAVWLDGEPVKSCTVLAAMAGGHEVRTVEGLEQLGELDPVQRGFMECHGLQCGFCTPGMLMTPAPCSTATRTRRSRRSARRSPARSAAAPATPRSCARSSGPRPKRRAPGLGRSATMASSTTGSWTTTSSPVGHGRMLRKEDPRFIRGQGPLRRRHAAARHAAPGDPALAVRARADPVGVDITAAEAHPKVKLVVTGAMLAERGLAWMPTLSDDVQAVLATDKVRFQGQEVAFVVAEDRYAARDALELIDVEYEPLPAVVDVRTALDPDAPVIRDDLAGKTDNHCFDWETGDRGRDGRRVRPGRRRGQPGHGLPAGPSGAAGDLRRGGRLRPGRGRADAVVAPPRRRTRTARCTRWSPGCPSTRSG